MLPLAKRLAAAAAAALFIAAAGSAVGASTTKIWWTNQTGGTVASANIDGSGAANLVTSPAAASPKGLAFNVVSGRAFWFQNANTNPETIGAADLDGSNRTTFPAVGTNDPWGISFDQGTNRIYYSDWNAGTQNRVFWVAADGSSGGSPNIAYQGINARKPYLPSVDPANNRLYWMNDTSPYTIGWSTLAGAASSGEIALSGCAAFYPYAYLVVPPRNTIVWFDYSNNLFWKTDMDGSNCQQLTTSGGTTNGMAFDPRSGRVYYFVFSILRYFDLSDPSITGTVSLAPYVPSDGRFPVITTAPYAESVSATNTGTGADARLACTASWYPGIPAANFYSAPGTGTTYAWTRNGETIAGATSATLTPPSNGTYACIAKASNVMGEGSATSNEVTLSDAPATSPGADQKMAPDSKRATNATVRIASTSVSPSRNIVTRLAVDQPAKITQRGTFRARGRVQAIACAAAARTLATPGAATFVCTLTPRLRAVLRTRAVTVRVTTTVFALSGTRVSAVVRSVRLPRAGAPPVTG